MYTGVKDAALGPTGEHGEEMPLKAVYSQYNKRESVFERGMRGGLEPASSWTWEAGYL